MAFRHPKASSPSNSKKLPVLRAIKAAGGWEKKMLRDRYKEAKKAR